MFGPEVAGAEPTIRVVARNRSQNSAVHPIRAKGPCSVAGSWIKLQSTFQHSLVKFWDKVPVKLDPSCLSHVVSSQGFMRADDSSQPGYTHCTLKYGLVFTSLVEEQGCQLSRLVGHWLAQTALVWFAVLSSWTMWPTQILHISWLQVQKSYHAS